MIHATAIATLRRLAEPPFVFADRTPLDRKLTDIGDTLAANIEAGEFAQCSPYVQRMMQALSATMLDLSGEAFVLRATVKRPWWRRGWGMGR